MPTAFARYDSYAVYSSCWPASAWSEAEWRIGPFCRGPPSDFAIHNPFAQTPAAAQWFKTLTVDLFGPLSETNNGNRWALAVEDTATKSMEHPVVHRNQPVVEVVPENSGRSRLLCHQNRLISAIYFSNLYTCSIFPMVCCITVISLIIKSMANYYYY